MGRDMSEKVIREYVYMGRSIGKVVENTPNSVQRVYGGKKHIEFSTELDETELREILQEMPVDDKIHMKNRAYGLHLALGLFGVHEEDYLTDEDLAIYVLTKGFNGLTELNHKDKRAWHLVKDRGLEGKLFPADAILEDFPEIKAQVN
jgi:hypothetical protein